jgi:di/tricarboxylate transporter
MSTTALYGSWLSLGLLGLVAALLYWLWKDRRRRDANLSADDRHHFLGEDMRRSVVLVILTLLAVGIFVGSRWPATVNGRPSPRFLATWIGIVALIVVLLVLAMIDWLATQRYARRHREIIVREGMKALREEVEAHRNATQGDTFGEATNGVAEDGS